MHAVDTRYILNDNGVVTPMGFSDEEYPTDVFASRAESFIASTTSPYFLYVATLTPHTEQWSPTCEANDGFVHMTSPAPRHMGLAASVDLPQGAAFNESDLSDKPRWWNKTYPAMSEINDECMTTAYRAAVESLMGIDDLVGRVFAATDARGTTANTIFVFTSDNGFLYGQHRGREKGSIYEEAIHVPLYVTGPGIGVQTVAAAVLNNDLAPTICEWAGTAPSIAVDGRSFVPLLAGPAPWRTRFMAEHAAEDKPGWLMIRVDSRGRVAKYARYNSKAEELYDLVLDPAELASKHADPHYAGWRKTLKSQLNVLKFCAAAGCASVEDIP
jgi:arylsulfatase A-like enzyme